MKVFILNPPVLSGPGFVREGRCEQRLSSYQYVLLPVSLPSIGAVLKRHKVQVKVVDAVAENLSVPKIKSQIRRFRAKLLILNVSTVTFDNDMNVAKEIKKNFPSLKIAVIGVHVTALPEEALNNKAIDFVVRSEPEETVEELVLTLGKKLPVHKIKGLSYKSGKKIQHNPDRPFISDLDGLPFPDRSLVKNELYLMSMSDKPHTIILTSRGCPNQCTFCTAHKYYGRVFRTRSAKSVADEMEEAERKFDIHYATMWADTFTMDPDFVFELCRLIQERGLKMKWMCNSRVNTISVDLLKAMKAAGCIGIAYGVESGNQQILKNVKKGITLPQIEKAFKMTNQVGIESLAHVIFGLPGETKQTVDETIRFAKKIKPTYAQFYCAVPFPGTEFRNQAIRERWIRENEWSKYEINQSIIETPRLSQAELKEARRKAYLKFYLRPGYILSIGWRFIRKGEIKSLFKNSLGFLRDWAGL